MARLLRVAAHVAQVPLLHVRGFCVREGDIGDLGAVNGRVREHGPSSAFVEASYDVLPPTDVFRAVYFLNSWLFFISRLEQRQSLHLQPTRSALVLCVGVKSRCPSEGPTS